MQKRSFIQAGLALSLTLALGSAQAHNTPIKFQLDLSF